MVELEPRVYDFAQTILDQFDPERSRTRELTRLEASIQEVTDAEADKKKQSEQQPDLSVQAKSDKWDKVVKKMDLEEELEEAKQTDYERQRQEYMEKLVGCNKDHSKEIDLYDKTNSEKFERADTMLH